MKNSEMDRLIILFDSKMVSLGDAKRGGQTDESNKEGVSVERG